MNERRGARLNPITLTCRGVSNRNVRCPIPMVWPVTGAVHEGKVETDDRSPWQIRITT